MLETLRFASIMGTIQYLLGVVLLVMAVYFIYLEWKSRDDVLVKVLWTIACLFLIGLIFYFIFKYKK